MVWAHAIEENNPILFSYMLVLILNIAHSPFISFYIIFFLLNLPSYPIKDRPQDMTIHSLDPNVPKDEAMFKIYFVW